MQTQPWESVEGHGPEREPESAAAVANRAIGDDNAWHFSGFYCANQSAVATARKLDAERAERDAARRAEYLARQASTFAPIDETQAATIAGERGDALTDTVTEDLLETAHALGRTRTSARRAA